VSLGVRRVIVDVRMALELPERLLAEPVEEHQ